ncbi:DUF2232 domain-containing protein [Kovacikia minuta CCNUW1]|uniref:DUF2232 domain-containing protein n=1 Tax=Kovacikia minuta TaxID=2931930 RepID=UPI001CC918D2|nr:DUF2232 domain-containing protein [Kovacikia minuta]UBF26240.1 DUF2232 domain-containing protein [Kovacikia minuta CCNUW1]
MSGSAEEESKPLSVQGEVQGESSAGDSSAEETAWLEVEAELSRPVGGGVQVGGALEGERSPASTLTSPRLVDPLSPIVMVETAFLASAASLIWLVNYYFPMGPLLRIFFPIPIALTYLRWGNRAAWMGALVSGLLLSVLMGPARSILYVIPYGVMGVLLGVLWHRSAKWEVSVPIASLLGSFGFFFRIWLVSLLLGDDLWLYATTQVTDLLDWIFIKLGLIVQPSLWMVQFAIVILVIFSNVVYLFVVHLVAWFLLDRLGNPIPRPPKWVQVLMDYE